MDSLMNFYDFEPVNTKPAEEQLPPPTPSLADIDEVGGATLPNLEFSCDLQELLEKATADTTFSSAPQSELFPDLPPASAEWMDCEDDCGAKQNHACVEIKPDISTPAADNASVPEVQLQASSSQPLYSLLSVKKEDLQALGLGLQSEGDVAYLRIQEEPVQPVCVVESTQEENKAPEPEPSTSRGRGRGGRSAGKRRFPPKDTDEYRLKRERNNVAVRKSRDKAKEHQRQTEIRMKQLTETNETLQKKVDLLTKELTVLKGLFANVGAIAPKELGDLI